VENHRKYQQLIGIGQWLITCGRMDLYSFAEQLQLDEKEPHVGLSDTSTIMNCSTSDSTLK